MTVPEFGAKHGSSDSEPIVNEGSASGRTLRGDWGGNLIWACLFTVLFIPYCIVLGLPDVGSFHDDGIYLVTSEALANGDGYHLVNLPENPRQTKYPPGLPLVLALVWAVFPAFPDNLLLLKLVPLGCGILWMVASFQLLRVLGITKGWALGVLALIAASPFTATIATALLSETLFALLATWSVCVLERCKSENRITVRRVLFASLLAAAATLTRTVGVAVILGGVLWLLSLKRWRIAAVYAAVSGTLIAPWVWWTLTDSHESYYSAANYASWHIFSNHLGLSILQQTTVVGKNLILLLMTPAISLYPVGSPAAVLALVSTVVVLVGIAVVWRRNSPSVWFLAFYCAIVLCWAWPPTRFTLVVLPWIYWLSILGLAKLRIRPNLIGSAAILIALIVPPIWNGYRQALSRRESVTASSAITTNGRPSSPRSWPDFLAAASWIRENTSPLTIIIGTLDPILYRLTGRKALRSFEANPYPLFYSSAGTESPIQLLIPPKSLPPDANYVVVASPDQSLEGAAALHAEIADLEARGKLKVAFKAGMYRVLLPQ